MGFLRKWSVCSWWKDSRGVGIYYTAALIQSVKFWFIASAEVIKEAWPAGLLI